MTSRPTTDWPLVRKRFIINPTECQVPHHQLGLKTTEYRCLFRSPLWFQILRVVSRWWRLSGQSVVRCLLFFLSHIHHECRAHCLCSSYTPRLHITSCFRLPPLLLHDWCPPCASPHLRFFLLLVRTFSLLFCRSTPSWRTHAGSTDARSSKWSRTRHLTSSSFRLRRLSLTNS